MDCSQAEGRLSEYLENALNAEEFAAVSEHLSTCKECSALLDGMRAIIKTCQDFPVLDIKPELVETILLRTSGQPAARTFREWLRLLFEPQWLPKMALSSGLTMLFLALMMHSVAPRLSFSAFELLELLDYGVQQVYSKTLKANDRKNTWLAEFAFFKKNTVNRIRFLIERMEAPRESVNPSARRVDDRG